jgi:hypothetical protein
MHDKNHLHIDEDDALTDWLGKALRSTRSGTITINIEEKPAARITASNGNRILVDLLQPTIFKVPEDDTGIFDKLKTASEFGRKLSDNNVTLSILRRGKEAIRLGKDAKPTFSKLITKSDDIQMASVKELGRLKKDLKTNNQEDNTS